NQALVHTYTPAEQVAIAQRIEQDYAAFTVSTDQNHPTTDLINGTKSTDPDYLPYFRFYIVDVTGQVRDDHGNPVQSVIDPYTHPSLPTHFADLFQAPVNYTVVRFNDSPTDSGTARPGGHSDDVDLRNMLNSSIVQVDINGFLGAD